MLYGFRIIKSFEGHGECIFVETQKVRCVANHHRHIALLIMLDINIRTTNILEITPKSEIARILIIIQEQYAVKSLDLRILQHFRKLRYNHKIS